MQKELFEIKSHWRRNAKSVLENDKNCDKIIETLFVVLGQIHRNSWRGACHASCSILHILLKEQGIQNDLVIGEVKSGSAVFDHSWIEINGRIFDMSIVYPLDMKFASAPIVRNIDLDSMTEPTMIYGVNSGYANDPNSEFVLSQTLTSYNNAFPGHPFGLWAPIYDGGMQLGFQVNIETLKIKYSRTHWNKR